MRLVKSGLMVLGGLGIVACSATGVQESPKASSATTNPQTANAQASQPAAAADEVKILTSADNNAVITVAGERLVVVTLGGNPTTGFLWTLKSVDGESIGAVGKVEYKAGQHAPGIVGSGGEFVATFEVKKVGKSVVTLEYARPWEKDKAAAKTFSATIDVAEMPAATAPATGPATRK